MTRTRRRQLLTDQLPVACHCGEHTRLFTPEQVWTGDCGWQCHRPDCRPPVVLAGPDDG